MRSGFQANEGFVLLAADYCQIELRILSHFSSDPSLLAAFHRVGFDVFKAIAASWLGSREGGRAAADSEVTDEERNQVKQICYALIYGAGPQLVADQAGISVDRAKAMMKDFLGRYPGVQRFLHSLKQRSRKIGYVETLLGRRRYLSGLGSGDRKLRARAERQAVNTLCQGSAADLIKVGVITLLRC
jgi:DNA polymerase theta